MHLRCVAIVAIVLWVGLSESGTPCNSRRFNHDSVVCVCDENFCDTLDPIEPTARGLLNVYESDRAGKRLEKREVQFGNDLPGPIFWNVNLERTERYLDFYGIWVRNRNISIFV